MIQKDLFIALFLLVLLCMYCQKSNVIEGLMTDSIETIRLKKLSDFDSIQTDDDFYFEYQGKHEATIPNDYEDDVANCEKENILESNQQECLERKRNTARELREKRKLWIEKRRQLQIIWNEIEEARKIKERLHRITHYEKSFKVFSNELLHDVEEEYKSRWMTDMVREKYEEIKGIGKYKKTPETTDASCPLSEKPKETDE